MYTLKLYFRWSLRVCRCVHVTHKIKSEQNSQQVSLLNHFAAFLRFSKPILSLKLQFFGYFLLENQNRHQKCSVVLHGFRRKGCSRSAQPPPLGRLYRLPDREVATRHTPSYFTTRNPWVLHNLSVVV